MKKSKNLVVGGGDVKRRKGEGLQGQRSPKEEKQQGGLGERDACERTAMVAEHFLRTSKPRHKGEAD